MAVKHLEATEPDRPSILVDDEQPVAEAEDVTPVVKPSKPPAQRFAIPAAHQCPGRRKILKPAVKVV